MNIDDYQENTLENAGVMKTLAEPSEDTVVMDWRRDAGWNTLESLLGISAGGGSVGLTEALRENAVLACVDVISRDVSKVDCALYERLPEGGKRKVLPNEHWLAALLAMDPNDEHTWEEFWQILVIHLVLANNSFVVMNRSRKGSIKEFIPVMPGRVMIDFSPNSGEKIYSVSRGSMFEQSMLREVGYYLGRDDVIHYRKRVVDGLHGFATLAAGAPTIRLSKAIQDYQSRLYSNDGQTRVAVEQDAGMKSLSNEAFTRMKQELRQASQKMFRNGDAMLLEPGYKAKIIAMTAAELQVADQADQQIASTARLFGIPPHKIGYVKDEKYSNMEVFERLYAHDVIIPIAKVLETGFARSVLTPDERLKYFLQFDRRQMEIIDFKIRSEALKIGLQNGAIYTDEYRELFSMNPLPNGTGKRRLYPSTFNVVDEKDEVVLAAGAQPADKGEDNNEDKEDNSDDPKKGLRLVQ